MRTQSIPAILLVLMLSVPAGFASTDDNQGTRQNGEISLEPVLVYNNVLEIPPGGETRLVIKNNGGIETDGYMGTYVDPDSKLGQAAVLLPQWMKEDFVKNMIAAGSQTFSSSVQITPAFGDLDADGDDDMVVGRGTAIYFYRNIGNDGDPVFIQGDWEDWKPMMNVTKPDEGGFVSPTICDFTGDGYGDLIWGDSSEDINFMNNPKIGDGSTEEVKISSGVNIIGTNNPPTHLSPTVYRMGRENMTLFFGAENGELYYYIVNFDFGEEYYAGYNVNLDGGPRSIRITPGPASFSAPRFWSLDHGGSRLLSMGSGEGILYSYNFDQTLDGDFLVTLNPGFFRNVATIGPTTPVPADMNGDRYPDLVLANGNGMAEIYPQLGTNSVPYWAPDPHVPAFEVENYGSAFDDKLEIFYEHLVDEYLDSIISPQDLRYRDEIGFCCAYTPPSQLANNRLSDLLVENARYIYERDPKLDYVDIRDHTGEDYYTTTTYRVRVGDEFRWMEIPRDEYYWGIVHPRVTEEFVAYIDPSTGQEVLPENGGRYWREYLWEHADEQYPPGPDYPDDWTGPRAYYPRNDTPPLLKEVLEGVDVLWDLEPYEYGRGFDNWGKNNTHPWDYREHAIEKISHWVEKTLVINQQESPDQERPNQPVRIAADHNGNCGELQDLTIAGARSALIPARGVHLPGEDHVWSEFYLGGWHQWDNYWSDAGGVVANDLNYWWGWGGRGGSGIWATNGAGQAFDVGARYRSPDINGKLRVQVFDREGAPVQGARVVVMSHWVTEQINVDTGPYQGPLPTVPLPSIWEYTDSYGFCDLNVWRQNINVKVTSDVGSFVSGKFSVPETGGQYTMSVQLQSSIPPDTGQALSADAPDNGTRYLLSCEVIGSYQVQTDLTSGVRFRNEMDRGLASLTLFSGEDDALNDFHWSWINDMAPVLTDFFNGDENITISLSDHRSIKEHTRVRVKIWEVRETQGVDEPDLLFVNDKVPDNDGIEIDNDHPVAGWLVSSDPDLLGNITRIDMKGGLVPASFLIDDRTERDWKLPLYGLGLTGEPGRLNVLTVEVYENLSGMPEPPVRSFQWDVFFKDTKGPWWEELHGRKGSPWGAEIELGAVYEDPFGNYETLGWMDDILIWSGSSYEEEGRLHNVTWTIDTGDFKSGRRNIRLTTIDIEGNIQPVVYGSLFDPVIPVVNLTSPRTGDEQYEDSILVKGEVFDDVELVSFKMNLEDRFWDLTGDIDEKGEIDRVVDFTAGPGIHRIYFNATDDVGLVNSTSLTIRILPLPDDIKPIVSLDYPIENERIEKGGDINFRGEAYDNRGLASLSLQVLGRTHDLLGSMVGRTFSLRLDTSGETAGRKTAVVTAVDTSGNSASDIVHFEIYEDIPGFRDREVPDVFISEPLPDQEIELGSTFRISGSAWDDGPTVDLLLSLDRGESYEDVTSILSRDMGFEIPVDTMDLLNELNAPPNIIREIMEEYPVMFRVTDGAGRENNIILSLKMTDTRSPDLIAPSAEFSEEDGRVDLEVSIDDIGPVEQVTILIFDPDDVQISSTVMTHSDLPDRGGMKEARVGVAGPFTSGTHRVVFQAKDAWGNRGEVSTTFNVPVAEEEGGGLSFIPVILGVFGILFVVPLILYGTVRAFRRRKSVEN